MKKINEILGSYLQLYESVNTESLQTTVIVNQRKMFILERQCLQQADYIKPDCNPITSSKMNLNVCKLNTLKYGIQLFITGSIIRSLYSSSTTIWK